MQGALWTFVGLSFLLSQANCSDIPTEDAIYSSTQVNGTEGKVTSITTHIPIKELPENSTCQWLKNGNTIEENGRLKYSEERSTGKYSLEINSTQRNDKGTYKYVCGDAIESPEKFLNVIEIPAKEYPNIELEKVSNDVLVLHCITEKLLPIPELMFHEEEDVLYESATHFLINKTVPITSVIPNATYICVLQLKGYYRRFETITGSQIIEYWNKTAHESEVKTTQLNIPVYHKEDNPTNEWFLLALEIAGGIFIGTVTFASLYLVITFLIKKSRKNNKTSGIPSSLEMGKLMMVHEVG